MKRALLLSAALLAACAPPALRDFEPPDRSYRLSVPWGWDVFTNRGKPDAVVVFTAFVHPDSLRVGGSWTGPYVAVYEVHLDSKLLQGETAQYEAFLKGHSLVLADLFSAGKQGVSTATVSGLPARHYSFGTKMRVGQSSAVAPGDVEVSLELHHVVLKTQKVVYVLEACAPEKHADIGRAALLSAVRSFRLGEGPG